MQFLQVSECMRVFRNKAKVSFHPKPGLKRRQLEIISIHSREDSLDRSAAKWKRYNFLEKFQPFQRI